MLKCETGVARDITAAGGKAKYDCQFKTLLSNKIILANILSNVVNEFKGMDPEKIVDYIEEKVSAGNTSVRPGETNNEKIVGDNTESSIPDEGSVYFDVKFSAVAPTTKVVKGNETTEGIKVIINVEGQTAYNPGYPVQTRGIFYGARMISSQLSTEFEIPKYQDIKKVYSIWICTAAPEKVANSISEFSIKQTDIFNGIENDQSSYDKLSVIVITLNEKLFGETGVKTQSSSLYFIRMLNILFSSKLKADIKKKLLETEFKIKMTQELGEELDDMCNASLAVEYYAKEDVAEELIKLGESNEKIMKATGLKKEAVRDLRQRLEIAEPKETTAEALARKEGREEGLGVGREAGRKEGREETKREIAKDLIMDGMSDEKTSRISKLDLSTVQEIRKSLNAGEVSTMNLF